MSLKHLILVVCFVILLISPTPCVYADEGNSEGAPEVGAGGTGMTRFTEKGLIGPSLYIGHEWIPLLEIAREREAMIASLALPSPYSTLVSEAIKTRTHFIKLKDKGRGVKLQWTKLIWIPSLVSLELFTCTSQ